MPLESNFHAVESLPGDDLLLTKLEPPRLHASLVVRPRLLERLSLKLDKRLTLVTAPTGYGKTTLVSMWIASQHLVHTWLTLDESDNDPARFWRYLITACRKLDPRLGKISFATLRSGHGISHAVLLTPLINELASLPGPAVMVLDDFQTISSPDVLASIRFLVEHLPAGWQVVLITRQEPDLPLGLLRARNELNELHAEDLRFSEPEIQSFLDQTLAFPLSPDGIHLLEQKTEGWAAGLRLVTLAMQAKNPPQGFEQFIRSFSGEHRFVLEYLRSEVIQKQPERVQVFLLQTSFLGRLCGPLCDAVTGQVDGSKILAGLEQADLFVVPLGECAGQSWFRYQPLFAEALRHDALQAFDEPKRLELYARASRWHQDHGFLEEAIEAGLLAQEFEPVSRLIEQFLEQRSINEVLTLRRWCDQIPAEVLYRHSLVAFHYALALLFTLDRFSPTTQQTIEPFLQAAEKTWEAQKDHTRLGELLAARAAAAWWQGEMQDSFDYSRRALSLLLPGDVFWRGAALLNQGYAALLSGDLPSALDRLMEARALSGAANNIHIMLAAILQIGEVYFLQGELEQAEHHYRQVLAEALAGVGLALDSQDPGAGPIAGEEMLDDQSAAWLGLAEIAYARGQLALARDQTQRALEISQQRLDERTHVLAVILLARIEHAESKHEGRLEQLEELLSRARRVYLRDEITLVLSRLCLAAGDLAAARRWHTGITQPERLFAQQRLHWEMLEARLEIAEGAPDKALVFLESLRSLARAQGRRHQEIEMLCLSALAHQAQSHLSQASQVLSAALSLAQPKDLRQVILDEGVKISILLRAAAPELHKRSLAAFAAGLLQDFGDGNGQPSASAASASAQLIEPLSSQELRVLRLLAAGRSYPEIAGELVVSVNTIKTQVKSIYRKLVVNNREEARQAAHELGLI